MTQEIVGQIQAIYYENPTNLYKVIRVLVDPNQTEIQTDSELVMTGYFSSLHYETDYSFYGQMVDHPKYGEQFSVSHYQQRTPSSAEGLIAYLSSDRFSGIGKKLASNIVQSIGEDAIDKILSQPDLLDDVKGLTAKKAKIVYEGLVHHRGTERIYMQLNQWGFSMRLADKIFQKYQMDTLDKLKENPYRLIEDIEGIGFARADSLADQLGFEPDDPFRIMAALYAVVSDLSFQSGDTYIPQTLAKSQAVSLLEKARPFIIGPELIEAGLDKAILEERLLRVLDGLMIPSLYMAERGIASQLDRLLTYNDTGYYPLDQVKIHIETIKEKTGIDYDHLQEEALYKAIQAPVSIITGGPGTGKTTLVKGLIDLFCLLEEDADFDPKEEILLVAPTGRAAKRMNEMTGMKASTIHRLLGFNKESGDQSEEGYVAIEQIEGHLLIVDEMSMVDTWLMHWLLQAVPNHMKVVLVGDKDQLPSVGPGKVFSDLIASSYIPTIQLERIYRQGQDSSIISLAHAIRQGSLPSNFMDKQADRSFIACHDHQTSQVVTDIVKQALKKGFDIQTLQVLAPMYKGQAGIDQLNQALQALINPAKAGTKTVQHFDNIFRVGDKVLQLVNNAEADIYNGDIGIISAILDEDQTESNQVEVEVNFDGRYHSYRKADLDQITLAYCCSIHKAQGSEYPLVILPMLHRYGRMLRKDLLYTAVTRAKTSLVLVGNPQAFQEAVKGHVRSRQTLLPHLLGLKFKGRPKLNVSDGPSALNSLPQDQALEEEQGLNPGVDHEHEGLTGDRPNSVTENLHHKSDLESKAQDQELMLDYCLTVANVTLIDPMVGMDGISPYDFL